MHAEAEIRDRVRRFVHDAFLVDGFRDDDSFLERQLIDSLGMMQLVSFLESDLGVAVADQELVPENFDSVERVARYAAAKLSASAGASAHAAAPP